jgi:methylmalonyl-CoA/ethylmalonyl-CoA epimerase
MDTTETAAIVPGVAPDLSESLGLAFDHVAVAAPRLRDLLPLYMGALGGRFVLGSDNRDVGWRAVRLRLDAGPVIELMEPLKGSSFFDSFFARSGGGGLHHVTFVVENVIEGAELLKAHGYAPIRDPDPAASYQELFLHPRTTGGVLLQLQRKYPSELLVAPPGQTLETVLAGHGYGGTGVPSP